VVRGKIVKVVYFKEQGLEVFFGKIKARELARAIIHKHPAGVFCT